MQFGLTMEHEGQTDYVVTLQYQMCTFRAEWLIFCAGGVCAPSRVAGLSLAFSSTSLFGTGSGILVMFEHLSIVQILCRASTAWSLL